MLEFKAETTGPILIAVSINDGNGYAAIDRQGRVQIQGEIQLKDLIRVVSEFMAYVPIHGDPQAEEIRMLSPI